MTAVKRNARLNIRRDNSIVFSVFIFLTYALFRAITLSLGISM